MQQSLSKSFYWYHAFGLSIQSEIPLPVESYEPSEAEIYFGYARVPEKLEGARVHGAMFESSGNKALIAIPGVARYLVEAGCRVSIEAAPQANESDIAAFLSGMVCGILMHQRHLLPIHGTAVGWEGKCLVFSGISGAGKSTMAAWFVKHGAMLVADDISAIRLGAAGAELLPGFPILRLWEDSLKELGIPPEALHPVRPGLRKFFLPSEKYQALPIPIDAIFVLGHHNRNDILCDSLRGMEKFRVLKNNVLRSQFVHSSDIQKLQFPILHQLAGQAEVYRVRHPRKLASVHTLGQWLIDTLKG